jgi:hypothetical protein
MTWQVCSYGGGIQSVAMTVLILQGRLPRPDKIIIADTGREKSSTWDYLAEVVQPALEPLGLQVEIASHELATVDLHSGNGDLLIPVYTATGNLPTFCSTEWKERVVKRHLRAAAAESVECWIGYSMDEADRAHRTEDLQWYARRYPLLELGLTRADCKVIIKEHGWPLPLKSACWMCPNQDDEGWQEMKQYSPADFAKAVELEKEIQEWDGEIWLHESRKSIAEVEFQPGRKRAKSGKYQCSFGCFV